MTFCGDAADAAADCTYNPPPPEAVEPREKAVCTVAIGNHSISYFAATKHSTARFEATCKHPGHLPKNRCRLTRHIHDNMMDPNAGRPLGLLVAWLLCANNFNDLEEHECPFLIKCLLRSERIKAREWLKTLPNGLKLLSFERKQRDGEPEEPLDDVC